tara:strand:+ start:5106 stop:6062 length:957 start_codon:yes stop_codon:yes gene_type:complete
MGPHSLAVIFPTRNNSGQIRDHLIHARSWIGLASEVIVVDSSTDDTLEICRSLLPGHTKIIEHPPGLYASWNAAIQSVESEFLYISTISDTLDHGFLERMLDYSSNHSLDMLISPPRFIGEKEGHLWPIHKFISKYEIREFVCIEGIDTVILNYLSLAKYGLSSLSGSFASNLVRTKMLQKRQFPNEFGGFGDAMWFSWACAEMRLGLLPDIGSTFLIHSSAHHKFSHDELYQCWQKAIAHQMKILAKLGIKSFSNRSHQYHACKMNLKQLRANKPGFSKFTFKKSIESIRKKYFRLCLNWELKKLERRLEKSLSLGY